MSSPRPILASVPAWGVACLCLLIGLAPVRGQASGSAPTGAGGNNQSAPTGVPTSATYTTGVAPQSVGQSSNGFWDRSLLTGDWNGLRKKLDDDGVTLTPTYFGELFGNPSGGRSQGLVYDGLMDVVLEFDLEKMSGGDVEGLTIHADAEYSHGSQLSPGYIGDFSNTSDIAAFNTLALQELWIQKWLWNKRLSIKAGNIAIDSEFFQSSTASLFVNSTFGAFTLIANNIPNVPVYPLASPGVRFQFIPVPEFYAMAGVFGMDNGSSPATNNQNGTRFALNAHSGMLIMSEVGYLLNQGKNDKGLPGSYRLGSFVHTANYDTWGSQADAKLRTGPLQGAGTNYGIYAVMDQQLYTHGDESISFFVRSAGAPSNVNFVDWYVDGGFNFTGYIPGRKNDIAGLSVGRSHVSSNFSDSRILEGDAPYTAETALEATYKIQLAPWWTLQPDFQYVITPSGEEGSHNATVLGLRTTVAF